MSLFAKLNNLIRIFIFGYVKPVKISVNKVVLGGWDYRAKGLIMPSYTYFCPLEVNFVCLVASKIWLGMDPKEIFHWSHKGWDINMVMNLIKWGPVNMFSAHLFGQSLLKNKLQKSPENLLCNVNMLTICTESLTKWRFMFFMSIFHTWMFCNERFVH